tara:strand:- start:223 stop:1296 length:1074 start_codon:yes stop_codon:yes gene_type:complete
MERVYVLDCGVNQSTLFDSSTGEVTHVSHDEVLKLHERLDTESTLVCEYAHLGCPRGERSLSQPFEAEQLLTLYRDLEDAGIILKLFPQQSTPRACSYSKLPKNDKNDPRSIYNLLKDFPEISLMNPPSSFEVSDKRQLSWDMKDDINYTLNLARRYKYLDKEDENTKLIESLMSEMESELSESTKEIFGVANCRYLKGQKDEIKDGVLKKGRSVGDIRWAKVSMTQLYSVLACLQDQEGKLRLVNGKLSSWKFIKRYVLGMTPFHFRGGVARSNLYYHGMKNYIISEGKEVGLILKGKSRGGFFKDDKKTFREGTKFTKQEDDFFLQHRKVYNNAIRELYRFFECRLSAANAGLPE